MTGAAAHAHSEALLQTHICYSIAYYTLEYILYTGSTTRVAQAVGSTLVHYLNYVAFNRSTHNVHGRIGLTKVTNAQFIHYGGNEFPQCMHVDAPHINLNALTDFPLKMLATSPDTAVLMPPLRSPARYSAHTHRTHRQRER